jgi:hypothetical protein
MRVVMKRGAIDRLLSDPRVREDLNRRAQAIADACNAESSWGGYRWAPEELNKRPSANVWSYSAHARADNARSNRLLRALDAGRG